MKGSYLTDRYIKRMQQGGGVGVFAPNPQPYRSPLQGLDPNVFRYEVNTKPLDTSGIIQVMQTKDNLAIQQEKMVVDREQMALRRELQEKQLEFEEAKMMNDLMADIYKVSGGKETYDKQGNLLYTANKILDTKRYAPLKAAVDQKRAVIEQRIVEIAKTPGDSTTKRFKIAAEMNQLRNLMSTLPVDADVILDINAHNGLMNSISNPESEEGYSIYDVNRYLDSRPKFLNGEDNGYKLGQAAGLTKYNKKTTDKALQDIITNARKITKVGDVQSKPAGGNNTFIITEEKGLFADAKTAADVVAQQIMTDRGLAAHASNLYQLDLLGSEPDKVVPLLKEKLLAKFAADDKILEMQSTASEKFEGKLEGDKNSTVTTNSTTKRIEDSKDIIKDITSNYTFKDKDGNSFTNFKFATKDEKDAAAWNVIADLAPPSTSEKPTEGQDSEIREKKQVADYFIELGGDITNPEHREVIREFLGSINPSNSITGETFTKLKARMEPLTKNVDEGTIKLKQANQKGNEAIQDGLTAAEELKTGSKLRPAAVIAKKSKQGTNTTSKKKWKLN